MDIVKARFEDFLDEHANRKEFKGNADAEKIFSFLSDDNIIEAMIKESDNGNPALRGCIKELEHFIETNKLDGFDIANKDDQYQVHLAVGQMISVILKPFGYERTGNKKDIVSKYFQHAMCYQKEVL